MSDLIIYNTEDGKSKVSLFVAENEVWITQNQLAELFDTSVRNISEHIKNIFNDNELDDASVMKDFFITATDGKNYSVKHYALAMILAIGFRVRSPRGVQFRRWANSSLRTYLEKGFLMDDERLKIRTDELITLMNYWNESEIFEPAKCVFIKKCESYSNYLVIMMSPTKPPKCSLLKHKIN